MHFLLAHVKGLHIFFLCNLLCCVYNNFATSKTDQYINLVWPIFRALNKCTKYVNDQQIH